MIDMTLVENDEVELSLLSAGERREKIRLIKSGVDLSRYRPTAKSMAAKEALGIGATNFVAGFSGRLSPEKAPLDFIAIAAQTEAANPIFFVMTGTGPMRDVVRGHPLCRGLGSRFHYFGAVEDIRLYLAAYDVLVLPSRMDGRPLIVLEALSMGIPVIASRIGGLPELISHGVTGFLCEPGDVADFAHKIEWLSRNPNAHTQMCAAARAYAERELDGVKMLNEYRAAIEYVLGPHAARAPCTPQSPGGR